MNEKIKELATQAHKFANQQTDADRFVLDVFKEKFAELIIQECLGVIESDIQYNQMTLAASSQYKIHNLASLKGAIGKLKQHFGVE